MGEVVSPRAETYSVTFHQWLTSGVVFMRILPTICVHMCSVASVSCQSSRMSSGQVLLGMIFSVFSVVNLPCGGIYHRGHRGTREETETLRHSRLPNARFFSLTQ